ncbi:MAG: 23S rRNA (uracil(1939)-C(5))-methyltransferase RlmD [Bacilli bacterium]|nr:23S rRNA (uracil(1939)-C(5))-methyltransferase RlmD [Bacilli bacterium]
MKQIIRGVCTDISSEGLGIIKANWMIIFVNGLLLGEEADVEIQYKRAGVFYANIKKIYKLSKDRIKPLCPVSTACGGCTFQNATYSYELAFKKKKVEDALRKIGHISHPVNDVIGMDEPYNYRNKIQVPFGRENKHVVYGFYKANTHRIIPIKECSIEDKKAGPILQDIAYLMESMKIDPYNEDARSGVIRHVLIRTSKSFDEVMVVLVTNVNTFPSKGNFVKELTKRHPEIKTVVQNINTRDTNVILGEKEEVLFGKGFIKDTLLGIEFHISSKSFFQVNPVQCEKLYDIAIGLADIKQTDEILDAYAGVATIGILCAKKGGHVTSVESVKEAVINGRENAKRNNITNIDIIEDDCTNYLLNTNRHFDVVIMDPPRKGSTEEFLKALNKIRPSKIIYISCEPSTLARDLSILSSAYSIDVIQPLDMFPRSFHVETIVGLYRK